MSRPIDKTNRQFGEVLTLSECANLLQYGENSMRKMLKDNRYDIPVHYVGAQPRFVKSEVLEWLKARSNTPEERI